MRIQSFKELGELVMARPPRLGDVRMVAVDGRAGSGKSTFAGRLAAERARAGVDVALLHTDDLLDGWGHPANFSPYLRQWILGPLESGGRARYRVYDWIAKSFGADWRDLGHPELLIVEGVTAAAQQWRPMLSYSVLIDIESGEALRRGLERDGESMRPEWEKWRAHEDVHFPADRTETNVDIIVDGNPGESHDPETEFVLVKAD